VIRKIWREDLFKTFIAAGFLFAIGLSLYHHLDLARVVKQIALSWPLVFFGSIMLTEPSTVPPKARDQRIYGLITGVLFSMPFSFGPIYSTPELALLIGNIYSFIVSPKFKLVLTLREKKLVSEEVYEFRFVPDRKFNFIPGQYMEWTMGHNKPDIRGNRRYFTIASSPTESEVILATRISEDPKFKTSSFKKELLNINPGKKVFAGNLSGDFLLPKDQNQKIIWIAGGIGVTPMRSQAKYLLDKKEPRDIVFFYSSRNENSFTFKDLFEESKSIGIKPVYVTTPMTEEFIKSSVPDFRDRLVYLSGPNAMVENYEKMFVKMGLPQENLVTDYFPGF
jgi:ferredoxin-NADP reductase